MLLFCVRWQEYDCNVEVISKIFELPAVHGRKFVHPHFTIYDKPCITSIFSKIDNDYIPSLQKRQFLLLSLEVSMQSFKCTSTGIPSTSLSLSRQREI